MARLRIALTGATGYIGGALAARLCERGHHLVALVRTTSNTTQLAALGVELVLGDLADEEALVKLMTGADLVIHAAAELDFDAPAARMQATNVAGSRRVASALAQAGAPRVIAFSSIAAYGGSPADGTPATEDSPIMRPLPSRYSATKLAGQQALEAAAEEHGLALEQIFPSLVYGPPGKKRGSNVLLRQIALGRMPAIVGGDRLTSWIFLDDLIDAVVAIIERGRGPSRLLLAGEAIRIRDLVRRVATLAERPPPRLTLPLGMAQVLANLTAPWFALRGRRSPLSVEQLRNLARHWNFDDSAARALLNWNPRPLDQGLPPTVTFLLGQTP